MDSNFWAPFNRPLITESNQSQYLLTPSTGTTSGSLSLGNIEQLLFLERQRLAQSGFTAGFSNQMVSPTVQNQLQTSIAGSNIYSPYQVIDANATQIIANQPQFETLLKAYQQKQQQLFNNQTSNTSHKNETKSKNSQSKRQLNCSDQVAPVETNRFAPMQQNHNNRSNSQGLDLSQISNKSSNDLFYNSTNKIQGKSAQQILNDQLINAVALNGLQWNGETFTTAGGQQEVLLYEAISPAAAIGDNNQCNNFIDSLQLFGSTITNQTSENLSDVLPQYIRTLCESGVISTSQNGEHSFDAGTLFYSDPSLIPNVVTSSPTQNSITKSKSEIGIVLPIQQPQSQSTSTILTSSKSSKQSHSNPLIALPSNAYEQLLESQDYFVGYLANDGSTNLVTPVSVASGKEEAITDDSRSAIVLSNITGNVYINQYSMLQSNAAGDNETVTLTPIQTYDTITGQPIVQEKYLVTTSQSSDKTLFTIDKPLVESGNMSMPYYNTKVLPQPKSAFESQFLKFVAGQPPETLSSVTNSPIKNRPPLPKYIPDLSRPRIIDSSLNKTVVTEESIIESEVNPLTISSNITSVSLMTKFPAKFSHKLQNRAQKKIIEEKPEVLEKNSNVSIMDDKTSTNAADMDNISQKSFKWKKKITNNSFNEDGKLSAKIPRKLNSHLAQLADQNDPNVQWTIAKKQKEQSEVIAEVMPTNKQIPVLVIKAITSKTSRPGRGRRKKTNVL